MNVNIPLSDFSPDVQKALKKRCIKEGKTLRQVGRDILAKAVGKTPPAKKGGSR